MTAREIVSAAMAHKGTSITPYTLAFEPELYRRLTEHYGQKWEQKMLRQFTSCYLGIDTVLMRVRDEKYSMDGYGALWDMSKKPWHLSVPPLPEPTLEGYDFPTGDFFAAPVYRDKENAIRNSNTDTEHFRIINMGWGIFEHSWRLRGFENALSDMLLEESFYREMTERLTENYIAMLKAAEDVPAEAYLFGDDWGEQRGVIMGAATWRKFLKPCWARIYAEVHRQGKIVMQHSCGSISDIYDDLAEIGMDCHESVQPEAHNMEPKYIKEKYGSKISFWGCLGSQSILNHGTPAQIRDEIHRLRDIFRQFGGFMLAPAKPLVDEMPLSQACAVVEAFAELNN